MSYGNVIVYVLWSHDHVLSMYCDHMTMYCLQHVLHDVPDFEERRKFLEALKDKFEALLSPRLVVVFDTHATGERVRGVISE